MKVALVHDYLNQFGGAERVLLSLAEIFPEAPIYTLFYEPKIFNNHLDQKIIRTTFLDRPFVRQQHRLFIPLFARAAESINLGSDYDLIISDSAGWAKGIKHTAGYHLAYIHTPLRYAWEPEIWLGSLLPKPLLILSSPLMRYLRAWDKKAGQNPHLLLAVSNHIAKKIERYYAREAIVLYPPVDTSLFYPEGSSPTGDYFAAVGRLIHYKRFDLIIRVFNQLNLPLKIVGRGPEEKRIRQLARSNIEFIPSLTDNELRKFLSGAKAFIFPQEEDFGLAAAEAIACGTPVIAYASGGALEIVEDGVNGILFDAQTEASLAGAIRRLEQSQFNRNEIAKTAQKFSKEAFKKKLLSLIESLLLRKPED